MPFWSRFIALLAALALAVAAAGCGGDDDDGGSDIDVPADAIAVVGDQEITKAEYDRLLASAEKTYEAREQEFPAAGTPEFAQLRNAIVRSLVEQAQFEIAAEELDVTVTDEDVDKRLAELKEQFFEGDEQKYKDELEAQGLTEEQVKSDLRTRLLSEKVFEKVTNQVEVTDEDVQAYYEENEAQFETPASRDVRHIVVKSKAKADQLRAQLEGGANFAKLARQFSTDEASKKDGGKFTAQQGATVAPFDKVGVRPRDRRALPAGEDPVRLASHRGCRRRGRGLDAGALRGRGADPRDAGSRRRRTRGSTSGSRSCASASRTRPRTPPASSRLRPPRRRQARATRGQTGTETETG